MTLDEAQARIKVLETETATKDASLATANASLATANASLATANATNIAIVNNKTTKLERT